MPPIFTSARSSAYRKRIAEAGLEPDETVRRRAGFARKIFEAVENVRGVRRTIIMDPERHLSALVRMGSATVSSLDDPFVRDLTGLLHPASASDRELAVRWHAMMQKHGFCFLSTGGNNYGPYISRDEVLGLPQAVVAFLGSRSAPDSFFIEIPPSSFIDAASLLEDVVFSLNAYRYHELEPVASLLLTEKEMDGPAEKAREAFRRRVGVLSAAAEKLDAKQLSGLIDELAGSDDVMDLLIAGNKIALARYACLSARSYSDPDPVRHTLNALNGMVRGAYLSYGMKWLMLSYAGDSDPAEDDLPLSTLASMAFGDPFWKLAAIYSGNMSHTPNRTLNSYVVEMIRMMGFRPGQGQKKAAHFALSRSEEEIRRTALKLLNRELVRILGRPLEPSEVEQFGAAGRLAPLAPEHLAMIAGIWRERYMGYGEPVHPDVPRHELPS
jgi:hypothetical protein